jgi:glycosyltransferase involved in cell wall biosynthesis
LKRLLIFYSHFFPAFKAGGPVQSLANLVELLHGQYRIYVVCSAMEMGETGILKGIVPNEWNNYEGKAEVFYVDRSPLKAIRAAFGRTRPDIVYVNGIFLFVYTLLPLLISRFKKVKVVLAPRGMLQAGALAGKNLKKRLFLFFFKLFGFQHRLIWHATDNQEAIDIFGIFGKDATVKIASNIPRKPHEKVLKRVKLPGELRMVFLSVISAKKNLDVILSTLKEIDTPVIFDIYGPVKDHHYWAKCQTLMQGQHHEISYRNVVLPKDVQTTLAKYHVFVLPTKGENFGHAIYEAFSVGTPAIISRFTPWGDLDKIRCGCTIDEIDTGSLKRAINKFVFMEDSEFSEVSCQAHKLALSAIDSTLLKANYMSLL